MNMKWFGPNYTVGGPNLSPLSCPYRAVPYRFCYRTVFNRERDRYRTFFCPLVRSAKRTEPLIMTVRFLVFNREPYRTKIGAVRFAVPNNNRETS